MRLLAFTRTPMMEVFFRVRNTFLKLKPKSSAHTFRVQSEGVKNIYNEDYRREDEIALDKASISKKWGNEIR
jgi:uncharacterized protein YvpB